MRTTAYMIIIIIITQKEEGGGSMRGPFSPPPPPFLYGGPARVNPLLHTPPNHARRLFSLFPQKTRGSF